MNWPPLPSVMYGTQGPITVEVVEYVTGESDMGTWSPDRRVIQICESLPIDVQWSTLWHEWSHAAMDDSGASHALKKWQQELLCESWAAAHLAAMRSTQEGKWTGSIFWCAS